MDTFIGRYRNLIVLAAILFAQIIGLAVQVRRPTDEGETRLIRIWAISAVTPLEKAVVHSQEWVQNLWTSYVYLHGVRRENRELRAEIARMKIEDARLDEDALMARRIQALLGFKEQYVDSTVAAQVIGTSGSDQSRALYIDKGSDDGITTDMAVITPTGIVGKIVQVAPDWSQVLPINDQFSGVGAALKDSRLQGILKGAPNGATTLQYIMSDETVKPGEDVITSGGDRIFPKGLPIGKVASVAPGKDMFLNIRVIPSAHLDELEDVLVVTKITEKMPDTKDLGPLRASDILAERLPSVPNKADVDAAGNAKPATPGAAGSAQPGAAGAANPPAKAHPTASDGRSAAATAVAGTKPHEVTTPHATAAGATTNLMAKPKPRAPAEAGSVPTNAGRRVIANPPNEAEPGHENAPAQRGKPAPEPSPAAPSQPQPTPSTGAPPQ
jgi:rod shape-determining protein MreC